MNLKFHLFLTNHLYPLVPDEPDVPLVPDEPDVPEVPDEPEVPVSSRRT
jgi:hypothetical protein